MAKFSPRSLAGASATSAFVAAVTLLFFLLNYSLLLSSSSYLSSLESRTATPQLAEPALSPSQAAAVSSDVVSYVRGSSQLLSSSAYFTAREVSHLADVRKTMRLFTLALYLSAAAAVISALLLFVLSPNLPAFFFSARRAVFAAGMATIAASLLLILAASGSFDFLFMNFHAVFFRNGNWQFPSNYLLVNLFTSGFFSGFAKDIVVGAIINGIALVIAALLSGYFHAIAKLKRAKA